MHVCDIHNFLYTVHVAVVNRHTHRVRKNRSSTMETDVEQKKKSNRINISIFSIKSVCDSGGCA